MSLLNRKPVRIGRTQRERRDQPVFLVACDDTYGPSQYFDALSLPRVKVIVLPTAGTDPESRYGGGESSPGHVVDRLKSTFEGVKSRRETQPNDQFWVLLDTDHHIKDAHLKGTLMALKTARAVGFEVAMSNPCFELWLLLHHRDVAPDHIFESAKAVEAEIRAVLNGFSKLNVKAEHFSLSQVPQAIERARLLDTPPSGYWPEKTGTRVYRLLEEILGTSPSA